MTTRQHKIASGLPLIAPFALRIMSLTTLLYGFDNCHYRYSSLFKQLIAEDMLEVVLSGCNAHRRQLHVSRHRMSTDGERKYSS